DRRPTRPLIPLPAGAAPDPPASARTRSAPPPPQAPAVVTEPHLVRSHLTDIDHVGIAVNDLSAAVEEYRAAFGVEPAHRERVEDQGVEEVLFPVGTSYIQLLGALGPDTPVGRFLDRRGEGIHHVGYRVEDVRQALTSLRAA